MKTVRFFLPLLLLGFVPILRAQDEQLALEPPLSQVFPLTVTPGGARVPYPVLLNDHTILPPDAVLRFVYIDPNAGLRRGGGGGDDDGGVTHSHVGPRGALTQDSDNGGEKNSAAGAWGDQDGNPDAGIFDQNGKDDNKTRKKELQTEIWVQKDLFTDALNHATDFGTTFVYSLPAQNRPLTASLDLPEGMLLAEVDAHVRVLGLTRQSRAYVGGVRPGDEIRSLGGSGALATLNDFVRAYTATRRQARLSGNPTYAMEIWRPDEGRTLSIQIAAPPSIPSFL